MTDELYDFFGGNAPRKVEPIEDDDFDSLDDPEEIKATDSAETGSAEATPLQIEAAGASVPEFAVETSTPEPSPKSESHWDFLAGMLGIKKDVSKKQTSVAKIPVAKNPVAKSTAPAKKPKVSSKQNVTASRSVASKTPTERKTEIESSDLKMPPTLSSTGDFFGFDPIPSPEDDTILPNMFQPTMEKPVDEPKKSKFFDYNDEYDDESASNESDSADSDSKESDGDEYLEFEIEELDDSPYVAGEESKHGRRPRRRPASSDQREPTPNRRPDRSSNSDLDSADRERSPSVRSEAYSAEKTGDDATAEREGGKRRRRRRGRGRGKEETSDQADAANLSNTDFDDDLSSGYESPSSFVDEIGWESPASGDSSASKSVSGSSRDSSNRDSSNRDSSNRDSSNRDSSNRDSSSRDSSSRDTSSRDTSSRDSSSRDSSSRDSSSRDSSSRDTSSRDTSSRDSKRSDSSRGGRPARESGESRDSQESRRPAEPRGGQSRSSSSSASEAVQDENSGGPRRRRRRGGRSRRDSQSDPVDQVVAKSSNFESDRDDDDSVDHSSSKGSYVGYDDDSDKDFIDDDFGPEERTERQNRRPQNSGGRSRSNDDDDDDLETGNETAKVKFPTWAEAIAGLVESNIKNHSRSPNRGRPRNGGGGGGNRGRSR